MVFFKYFKYRGTYGQYKEIKEIAKDHLKPKLTSKQNKEIKNYFSKFTKFPINPIWHNFYSNINEFDVRYIPIDLLFCVIIPRLYNYKYSIGYSDKSRYEELYSNIKHPKSYLKRINGEFYIDDHWISTKDACSLVLNLENAIIKPTIETGQGNGVKIFNPENDILSYLNANGMNFIIQEKIEQHPILKSLNPSSLNTIRCVTYRKDNEVHILQSTLKIGQPGQIVDNGHHGGSFCGIRSDGSLRNEVYTLNPFTSKKISPTGKKVEGIVIPNFTDVIERVKELGLKTPYSRYAGWDIAIDSNGIPVFIEVNFRCPGGNIMQIPNGPLFGNLTETILSEIQD